MRFEFVESSEYGQTMVDWMEEYPFDIEWGFLLAGAVTASTNALVL